MSTTAIIGVMIKKDREISIKDLIEELDRAAADLAIGGGDPSRLTLHSVNDTQDRVDIWFSAPAVSVDDSEDETGSADV